MPQRSYPTVLIVEDEPLIDFYEAELAEGAGFLTVQAEDADRAERSRGAIVAAFASGIADGDLACGDDRLADEQQDKQHAR